MIYLNGENVPCVIETPINSQVSMTISKTRIPYKSSLRILVSKCSSSIKYSYLMWGTVSHRLFKWLPQDDTFINNHAIEVLFMSYKVLFTFTQCRTQELDNNIAMSLYKHMATDTE